MAARAAFLAALVALGAASGSAAGVATAPAYRVAIARGDAGANDADVPLPLPLVVGDPIGGRVPDRPIVLRAAVRPAPDAVPTVAWSATGKASLSDTAGASMFFSAPPGGVFLDRGRTEGPFTITARVGPPVDRAITVPAYGYVNGFAVCGGGNGLRFDAAGRPQEATRPEDADIYATGPGDDFRLFTRCVGAFVRDGGPSIVHVPGGAVVTGSRTDQLPRVSVHDLRPPLQTSFPADELGTVIVFRTRDGRIAKMGPHYGVGRGIAGPTLVARSGREFADTTFARTAHTVERPLPRTHDAPVRFAASIEFTDSSTGPYSRGRALEYALPYHVRTPFFRSPSDVHVVIAPVPYRSPDVAWRATGDAARLSTEGNVPNAVRVDAGDRPGAVTIAATVGAPVRRTVVRELDAYDSFVIGASASSAGVRFTTNGFVEAPQAGADVFISPDDVLHVPMGGVMLTNGADPRRRAPEGGAAGPPFTDLTAAAWRDDRRTLDLAAWRTVVGPCYRDESPGIERLDATCTTMHADVLLFKTRDGRFVKWHIVNANGTSIMGGPYEVLPR